MQNAHLVQLLAFHGAARNGRAYEYGNVGYNVAALAMDAVTKESWKETLRRLIFEPLRMTNTSGFVSKFPAERLAMPYRGTPTGFVRAPYAKFDANMQSAGGLVTTAADMGRWLEVHIGNGKDFQSFFTIQPTDRGRAIARKVNNAANCKPLHSFAHSIAAHRELRRQLCFNKPLTWHHTAMFKVR